VHVETESYEEEHNQLPFVEDVSEHRWSEEEEVNSDLRLENLYFGMFTAYEEDYVQYCIAKDEAGEHSRRIELNFMNKTRLQRRRPESSK
jgi:hypothetical protein